MANNIVAKHVLEVAVGLQDKSKQKFYSDLTSLMKNAGNKSEREFATSLVEAINLAFKEAGNSTSFNIAEFVNVEGLGKQIGEQIVAGLKTSLGQIDLGGSGNLAAQLQELEKRKIDLKAQSAALYKKTSRTEHLEDVTSMDPDDFRPLKIDGDIDEQALAIMGAFTKAEDALSDATKGTEEYNAALIKAMQAASKLYSMRNTLEANRGSVKDKSILADYSLDSLADITFDVFKESDNNLHTALKSTYQAYEQEQKKINAALDEVNTRIKEINAGNSELLDQAKAETTLKSLEEIEQAYSRILNKNGKDVNKKKQKDILSALDYTSGDSSLTVLSKGYSSSVGAGEDWEVQYQWLVKFVKEYEAYAASEKADKSTLNKYTELYQSLKPMAQNAEESLRRVIGVGSATGTSAEVASKIETEVVARDKSTKSIKEETAAKKELNDVDEAVAYIFGTDTAEIGNIDKKTEAIKKETEAKKELIKTDDSISGQQKENPALAANSLIERLKADAAKKESNGSESASSAEKEVASQKVVTAELEKQNKLYLYRRGKPEWKTDRFRNNDMLGNMYGENGSLNLDQGFFGDGMWATTASASDGIATGLFDGEKYFEIPIDQYDMFIVDEIEKAEKIEKFGLSLQKFIGQKAGDKEFDVDLKGISGDSLYTDAKDLFERFSMTKQEFTTWIENMVKILVKYGIDANGNFTKANPGDIIEHNFMSRLMMSMGYDGTLPITGNSDYDGEYHGAVIFNPDFKAIGRHLKDSGHVFDDNDKFQEYIDSVQASQQKALEQYMAQRQSVKPTGNGAVASPQENKELAQFKNTLEAVGQSAEQYAEITERVRQGEIGCAEALRLANLEFGKRQESTEEAKQESAAIEDTTEKVYEKIKSYEELEAVVDRYNSLMMKKFSENGTSTKEDDKELSEINNRFAATKGVLGDPDKFLNFEMNMSRSQGPLGTVQLKNMSEFLGIPNPNAEEEARIAAEKAEAERLASEEKKKQIKLAEEAKVKAEEEARLTAERAESERLATEAKAEAKKEVAVDVTNLGAEKQLQTSQAPQNNIAVNTESASNNTQQLAGILSKVETACGAITNACASLASADDKSSAVENDKAPWALESTLQTVQSVLQEINTNLKSRPADAKPAQSTETKSESSSSGSGKKSQPKNNSENKPKKNPPSNVEKDPLVENAQRYYDLMLKARKNQNSPGYVDELQKELATLESTKSTLESIKGTEKESAELKQLRVKYEQDLAKVIDAEASKEVKKSRANAKFGRVETVLSHSNDLEQQIKGSDYQVFAQENDDVQKFMVSLQSLRSIYDAIYHQDGVVEDKDIKKLQDARNETEEYRKKVEALFAQLKLGANEEDTGRVVSENASTYYAQLSQMAQELEGGRAKITGFNSDTNTLNYTVKTGAHELTNYSLRVTDLGKNVIKSTDSVKKLEGMFESIKRKTKEIFTYFSGSSIIFKAFNEIRKGITYVKEIDSALTELKKVTDETEETYDRFLNTASKTAAKVGSTLRDFTQATSEFARLGYNIEQASDMAEAALVYKNVGDGISSVQEASESIISTLKAFNIEATDSMNIVSKFNEVGNNFAITSKGIGDALQKSASALEAAGNSLDESIGLITGANTVVQNPESVGQALKTLSLRIRGAKVELEEAGESTDDMATSVSSLQKKILALTGNKVDIMLDGNTFKNTTEILREMSAVWDDMSDVSQASALELLGGKRQANILASIINNFDTVEEAIKSAQNSEGKLHCPYVQKCA